MRATTSSLLVRASRVTCVLWLLAVGVDGCGASGPQPAASAAEAASDPTQDLIPAGSAGSTKADRMTNPRYSACHASYQLTSQDIGVEVAKMAQGCAAVTKMHPLGDTFRGTQSAASAPQAFPFKAKAKHCYRAYGAAVATIKDLDLVIKDSTGAIAGEDSTDDPTPVVLEDGVVCFTEDDDASVITSVGDGAGAYAVQVWSD